MHRLVAETINKGRCREQDLGTQAVGRQRDFKNLACSGGRRRLGPPSGCTSHNSATTGVEGAAGCALMMAFRVAEKTARLVGSFNTSKADRASAADIEGVDGEPAGFCAKDGAGRPRRMAHSMRRTTRVIGENDYRYLCRVNADFGHEEQLESSSLHKPDPRPIVEGCMASWRSWSVY